jgi:RNA polymerase sigma-70 factor (ECF subfamily)
MKGKGKMATVLTGSSVKPQSQEEVNPGVESALDAAFDQHWVWVCNLLHRLIGDWDEAEDLALQVFLKLYQRPPRELDKIGSWLHRTATRAGLNALRSRQRRRRYEITAGMLHLQQASMRDPVLEVEQREIRRRVQHVLAQMQPRAAHLLACRMMGLSYTEIAAAFNVAQGSVGTLLARAEKDFERRYRALEENR